MSKVTSNAVVELQRKHNEIGELMEQAEKAGPFNALTYAKKAAAKSHELVGELITVVASCE